jgi:hypothetical protein
VLLGKHELGDLDWRGHRAVALRRDRHEVNFANKIVKQPESVGRKLGKEKKRKNNTTHGLRTNRQKKNRKRKNKKKAT